MENKQIQQAIKGTLQVARTQGSDAALKLIDMHKSKYPASVVNKLVSQIKQQQGVPMLMNEGGSTMQSKAQLKSFRQKDRYGNEIAMEFFDVPPMKTPEYDHPGDPKGTDTVPAWLTPGEFVINAEATRKYEPLLEEINNEGRDIQAQQGGSIPTYASDGGLLSSIYDSLTMPAAPPGIVYKRLDDGSIGQFTERTGTGGGQKYLGRLTQPKKKEDDSFSNFLGINYKNEGGYVMPDFLSDDALAPVIEGMYATETSSGENVKTSEDGAVGPMQILPSTAADPGYGVRPRTLEEIMTLEGAQDFAKEYLRGIHRHNPDFDLNQTITAYHSGPKHVRQDKEGVEPLGPRGAAYAGKVNEAAGGEQEVSFLDAAGNFLSEINPFGTKEAIAQVPPPTGSSIPTAKEVEDAADEREGNWYDFLFTTREERIAANKAARAKLAETDPEKFAQLEKRDALAEAHKIEKAAPPIRSGASPEAQEAHLIAKATHQAEQEKADLKVTQTTADLDLIEKKEEIKDAQEDHAKKQGAIKTTINAGATPPLAMIEAAEQAADKIVKLEEEAAALESESAAATAALEAENTDRMERAAAAAGIPPVATDDSDDTTTPDPETQKNTAEDVVRQLGPVNKMTPEGEADIETYLSSLESDSEESGRFNEQLETVGGWFTETFKEMFSGPELARMAITYLGSRVLGYDHSSSLSYSMKNYLTRIDEAEAARKATEAKIEERRFDLAKDNLDDYTAASRKKFMQTMDINDLVPKGESSKVIKEVSGSVNFIGKGRVNTYKDDDGIEYVKLKEAEQLGYPSGYVPVSILGDYIQPWDESSMGAAANRKVFADMLEQSRKNINAQNKDFEIEALPTKLATQLNAEFNDFVLRNGIGINEAERTRIQFAEAVDAFMRDTAEAKKTGKPLPTDIAPYIQERVVIPLTGINSAYLNGINTASLTKLDKKISQSTGMNPYQKGYEEAYKENWKIVETVFNKIPVDKVAAESLAETLGVKKIVPREDWVNRAKGKEETAFSLWLANTSFDEIQKLVDHFDL